MAHTIYIGTSGYNYQSWKNTFYPNGLPQNKWLEFYSHIFTTVEINATFYKNFRKSTYEKWAALVDEDFRYVIKGTKFITHIKKLGDIDESLILFNSEVEGLGQKLGVILWQFPASFIMNKENLIKLEKFISKIKNKKSVIELRHDSWFTDEVFTVLDKNKIGFVINDTNAFDTYEKITGKFAYIRFHGPDKLYASSYSDTQLEVWANKIKKYSEKYDVYCYFNNDMSGKAIANALKLSQLVYTKDKD